MVVAALFQSEQAEKALTSLLEGGLHPGRVSVLVLDRQPGATVTTEVEARLATHLGNYARWLTGVTTLTIPDLGLMLIAGPLQEELGNARGARGDQRPPMADEPLKGALMGWGFTESQTENIRTRVAEGEVLLAASGDAGALRLAGELFEQRGLQWIGTIEANAS
jgi:hypothetical protein